MQLEPDNRCGYMFCPFKSHSTQIIIIELCFPPIPPDQTRSCRKTGVMTSSYITRGLQAPQNKPHPSRTALKDEWIHDFKSLLMGQEFAGRCDSIQPTMRQYSLNATDLFMQHDRRYREMQCSKEPNPLHACLSRRRQQCHILNRTHGKIMACWLRWSEICPPVLLELFTQCKTNITSFLRGTNQICCQIQKQGRKMDS